MRQARRAAENFVKSLKTSSKTSRERRFVVMLGRNVAEAFRVDLVYLKKENFSDLFNYAVVPYPSGVNHWWNDPANVEAVRKFFEEMKRS